MGSPLKFRAVFAAACLLATRAAPGEIRLDFEGFPAEIVAPPGTTQTFTALATLTAGENEAGAGWSLSFTADGGLIVDVTTSGLRVMTDQGELPVYQSNFFSYQAPSEAAPGPVVHEDDPTRHGGISVVGQLNYPRGTPTFTADTAHRLARITVAVTMPALGETREVTLRYEDGFQAGGQGVLNTILYNGQALAPDVRVPRTVLLRGENAPFRRGETNQDGVLDVSDIIFALDHLFRGGSLPGCLSAVDSNDDGRTDISDPIYLILFLFYGGEPPPTPFEECGKDPTPDELTCVSYGPCV